MSLTPISRITMQGLKAAKDEEDRKALIQSIVEKIYNAALNSAKTKTDTSYQFRVPPPPSGAQQCVISKRSIWNNDHNMPQTFDMAHMTDILVSLRALFPDCSVSEKALVQAQDGKLYDISTMDPQVLPFIRQNSSLQCIVIDWS